MDRLGLLAGMDAFGRKHPFPWENQQSNSKLNPPRPQAYWPHNRPVGNGQRSPGVWGDNGWQRAGPATNDYSRDDVAAGSGGTAQAAFS